MRCREVPDGLNLKRNGPYWNPPFAGRAGQARFYCIPGEAEERSAAFFRLHFPFHLLNPLRFLSLGVQEVVVGIEFPLP